MKNRIAIAALMAAVAAPAAAQMAPMGLMSTEGFRETALMSDSFEIQSSRLALERSRNATVKRHARELIRDHQQSTAALSGGGAYAGRMGGPVGGLLTAPLTVAGAATGAAVGVVGGTLTGGPVGGLQGIGTGAAAGARAVNPDVDATASATFPVGPEQQQMLGELSQARGAQFDRLYGQYQVQSHRQAVAAYTAYVQTGTDPAMRNFATQVLPTLQEHLAMAERLPGGRSAR